MEWIYGWFLLGGAALFLVLINITRAVLGRHGGWLALLFASLACGGAALSCALLEVWGYVQGKEWDTMTDVVPALAGFSALALCVGAALNLLALWLHLRKEKIRKEAENREKS